MSTPQEVTIIPYLKTIWILQHEEQARVGITILSKRLSKAPATVSQTVRALTVARLIHHKPYGPIELTLKGEQLAIKVVRNDRIARAFLYRVLDYPWPDIAGEADTLMTVLHDGLANRLHLLSGSPLTDPYGNLIPGTGASSPRGARPLTEQPLRTELEILRVPDAEPALLDRLHSFGLVPGRIVQVERVDDTTEVIELMCNDTARTIGIHSAHRILAAPTVGASRPGSDQRLHPDRIRSSAP
ncbi:iron dependent repressor, metal binding and dimerization domain protein [Leucobacter sp. gxy201]|uniref:metal-dependent transcriptional regulator n=1 Tax=Leucobacter sp. gxy201 TaxID=2957200 RepID=UPI003DA0B1F1